MMSFKTVVLSLKLFTCLIVQRSFKNRTTFKEKTGYYLESLTPETTKLLESAENKISK